METLKEKIINLFYLEHFKAKDIAQKLKVSSAYITKLQKLIEKLLKINSLKIKEKE